MSRTALLRFLASAAVLTKEFPYTVGRFKGTKYVTGPLGGAGGVPSSSPLTP